MRRLLRPFLILLALVFLFEAWLWEHLAPVVAWIVARIPLRAIKARTAAWIEGLPPAVTLVVFVVPVAVLLPFKFLGLWLLAHGHWLDAVAVLALAKVAGLGVTAFIFGSSWNRVARMGARAGRSDQAPPQARLSHVRAHARRSHSAAAHAHPPAHADAAPGDVSVTAACLLSACRSP
jgi:hypothetical protein